MHALFKNEEENRTSVIYDNEIFQSKFVPLIYKLLFKIACNECIVNQNIL